MHSGLSFSFRHPEQRAHKAQQPVLEPAQPALQRGIRLAANPGGVGQPDTTLEAEWYQATWNPPGE